MNDRSPAIQFYFRQFSGDEHVLSMNLQEIGCHILLMCAAGASKEGYRLPNNEKVLRSICRNIRRSTWGPIFQSLTRGAWKLSRNRRWIEQDGLRRSFMKQQDFSNKQKEKAKKRWDAVALHRHPSGIAEGMPASASASASASALHTPEVFEQFWTLYPRKVGKPAAKKAWRGIPGADGHILEVLTGIERWQKSGHWADPQFIPHPSTFLNQRRWEDQPTERKSANGKTIDFTKTDEVLVGFLRDAGGMDEGVVPNVQVGGRRRPN